MVSAIKLVFGTVSVLACFVAAFPKGHMKPFGYHQEPGDPVEVVDEFPAGPEFLRQYVAHHRPVIFRGACSGWPAKSLFTDEWLSEKMGSYKVRMETKNDDKRASLEPMAFNEFLRKYRHSNLYLVDEVPKALMEYVEIPEYMRCSEVTSKFFVTFLWISSGNTDSRMHIDTDENMLCVLEGVKTVYLVDPKYSADLYADDGMLIGVSPIDPVRLDFSKYPRVADVPYRVARVEAGSCFLLPQNVWHFVHSSADEETGRNVAVAMWWKSRPPPHRAPFRRLGKLTRAFSDVLDAYEDYVQRTASMDRGQPNCSDHRRWMAEYDFASDRTEDGEYGEDDKAERDEFDWANPMAVELGIEQEYGSCQFNLTNPRNPCFVSFCMADDDTPACLRYTIDYCRRFSDNGCMDLVWTLNKKSRAEYRGLLLLPDLYSTPLSAWPTGLENLDFDRLPQWAARWAKQRKHDEL